MAQALEMDILDLRHFSAGALRTLLDEEAAVWRERLRWDYRASAKLLLEYLDGRILPGFVAMENQRVVGYLFCVYEQNKAVIGDVFATNTAAEPAAQIESVLLEHLLEMLQSSPGVDRIETQLLLHPEGRFTEQFVRVGFTAHPRLFMERTLERSAGETSDSIPLPEGLAMRPWRETDFPAAGRLISNSYAGHLDSTINDQYRTTSGSLRFLHNIVRFPGCGFFDPTSSLVLTYRDRDDLAALLLASRVSEDTAHVTQLCVAPAQRRQNLGKLLLRQCFGKLAERGMACVTLTVTEGNASAVHLYRECGFVVRHTFDAMVWDKRERRAAASGG